jgi:hypothetical protein
LNNKIIDTETFQFIFQNAKLLTNDISDELLTYFIDKVVNDIVINTNRAKFPKELRYLSIDMVKRII